MWGGITVNIKGVSSLSSPSSSTTRNVPQTPGRQNRNNTMKQKTSVHVDVKNYSGSNSSRPPKQYNPRTSNNQNIGQGQGKSKGVAYPGQSSNPQHTRQPQGLHNANYSRGTNCYQGSNKSFAQNQKPVDNINQRYRKSNQNNQGPNNHNNFTQASRQEYTGGKPASDGNYKGPNSSRVVVVKTTKIINKKIIINRK